MRPMAAALGRDGYTVLNLGYPSRSADVLTLAVHIASRLTAWDAESQLDFVTHSLGGILLRIAVAQGLVPLERVRRVVMLGPPNSGSEIINAVQRVPMLDRLYRRLAGPAVAQLGVGPEFIP